MAMDTSHHRRGRRPGGKRDRKREGKPPEAGGGAPAPPPLRRPSRREGAEANGWTTLAALLVLAGLTALAVTGLLVSGSDLRTSEAHARSVRAGLLAQQGLARYLAEHRAPTAGATYLFGQDSAVVTLTRSLYLDPGSAEGVYLLRARGVDVLTGRSVAERTVGVAVVAGHTTVTVPGGFTSGSGLDVNGNSATISGADACAPGDSVAGAAVPAGSWEGNEDVLEGSPPLDTTSTSGVELLEQTGIDWEAVENGELVLEDVTIPGDGWPDYDTVPASAWPVIRITAADYTLGSGNSGWGTIVAEENLELSGSMEWRGLILVGETLRSDGNQTIDGGLITGLDLLLGESVDQASLGNGTKTIRYSSCDSDAAASTAFQRLSPKPGTWTEVM